MPTEAPLAFDASEPPMDSSYELHAGEYRSGELRLLSFSGREEVNGIYAFEVLFWTKHVDEARLEGELLGTPSAIGMHVPGGPARWVRGIVAAITLEGAHPGGRHAFRMSLVPRLWLLGKRVNSRIFQDKTVQQIVDIVLDEHGIMREWSLLAKYPERQYCVQYQESDLQFVIRMLAEEGIFFSFVHPEGEAATECLQLADSAHSYAPIDGDPKLVYRHQTGDGAMKAEENQVLDFRLRTRMEPTAVVMRDYDFRRPKLDLTSTTSALVSSAQDPTTTRPLEIYDHHGEYEETDVDTSNATVYLEQLRANVREAHGSSVCRRLSPGRRFDLAEHEIGLLDASWVVTYVEHHGISAEAAKSGARVYENRFRCVPAEVPCRPPRPLRVARQVIESAVVVGPEGQEIFTDAYGRVKVQFHWDREGQRDEHSSCWMRVVQAWAGTGWGFQFIPRVGMEVVVSFLGGDLDRPVIMGCLANAANPLPHAPTVVAGRSGIRTRSTPGGGGYNELMFDDTAGAEEVRLIAQRNRSERVGGERSTIVLGDSVDVVRGSDSSTVDRHRIEQTGGDRRAEVGRHQQWKVEGNASFDVGGDATDAVRGDRKVRVAGSDSLAVEGSTSTLIQGDSAVVVQGKQRVSVGEAGKEAPHEVFVRGDYSVIATGKIELKAEKGIVIDCGGARLQLTSAGLSLAADDLAVTGSSAVRIASGGGAVITLDENIESRGKKVSAFSEKASMTLERDARLDGKNVKLNCDPDPPPESPPAKPEEPEEAKDEKLESTFARDHLVDFAKEAGELYFCFWMMTLFGADVPVDAYRALYKDLTEGSFVAPPIMVMAGSISGHAAAYNRKKKRVEIGSGLCRGAETDNEVAWKLASALVEELGHHLDHVLRNEYSTVGGDAMLDEGARFGYAVLNLEWTKQKEAELGTFHRDGADVKLKVKWDGFESQIEKLLGAVEQQDDARDEEREYFGAGTGADHAKSKHGVHSFGHQSVEWALERAGFDERERLEVYFGNWLRDYSQVIVGTTLQALKRDTLVSIVDVLAQDHFKKLGAGGRVSRDMLGVYYTHEHIDGLFKLPDDRAYDPDFEVGHPTDGEKMFEFDASTWLRNHIATPPTSPPETFEQWKASGRSQGFTAKQYIEGQLRLAVKSGATADGRRHFGQGLHTLEDFFAHSNFCELALYEIGHTGVITWSPKGTRNLLTGCFGGDDAAATILLAICENIEKDKDCKEIAMGLRIAQIVLKEKNPTLGKQMGLGLDWYEGAGQKHPYVLHGVCFTVGTALHVVIAYLGSIAHLLANQIDDYQTTFSSAPGEANPTHTQIAKDHDDHPLHVLAASLAKEAVEHTGKAMKAAWAGTKTADDVCQTATRYLVHPAKIPPGGDTARLLEITRAWAAANPQAIKNVSSESWLKRMQEKEIPEMRREAERYMKYARKLPAQLKELVDKISKQSSKK